MSWDVFSKLLAIVATVALGTLSARLGLLGRDAQGQATEGGLGRAAQVMSELAFNLFVPALLFRTMVRLDFSTLPGDMVLGFFGPAVLFLLAVYGWERLRVRRKGGHLAQPCAQAVSATYGNAVQLGIPVSAALFGEPGLALHLALVSVHAVILLTLLTVLVEVDLARANHQATLWGTLRVTVRKALIHPVTLPILLGSAWNLTGLGLTTVLDDALKMLASAVVPLCLILIGANLAQYGLRGRLRQALGVTVLKLLVLPALVLVVAWQGLGLTGLPLAVLVMMASLPTGSNALMFAQRYQVQQAEATAAIVVSTVAFAGTASLWLALLHGLGVF